MVQRHFCFGLVQIFHNLGMELPASIKAEVSAVT